MPHGVEKVGLSQTGAAVDEQRVVVSPGLFGDRHRRGPGEAVGLSDDEALEAISGDQVGGRPTGCGSGEVLVGNRWLVEGQGLLGDLGLHHPVAGCGVGPEGLPVGGLDEVPVLVDHPAEMKVAGSEEDRGLAALIRNQA